MDVCLCLECWLQVVMDNGQEKKLNKGDQIQSSCFEKKKGETWNNDLVHHKDLLLVLV